MSHRPDRALFVPISMRGPAAIAVKPRPAFTLVELLVVIAIIGILIALLLPAVQAAREAARRSQCTNHLKQMALGLQNYHDTYKTFPPGHIIPNNSSSTGTSPNAALGHNVIGTWPVLILPFVEQKPLHDMYDKSVFTHEDGAGGANKTVRQTSISFYSCPSDQAQAGEIGNPGEGARRFDGTMFARSSYAGVAGKSYGHPNDCNDRCGNWDFTWGEASKLFTNGYTGWRGVLPVVDRYSSGSSLTSCVSFANLRDGASNTIAIGEAHMPSGRPDRGPFWALGANTYTIRTLMPNPWNIQYLDYNQCESSWPGGHCQRSWGAYHPGGLNWAVADGSVRFISQTVDLELLIGLASTAGKEAAQIP